ncbi:MAG: protein kinase [Eubacteriales bacterium]|nr:protein kinase [Eubacteriales bacterium]
MDYQKLCFGCFTEQENGSPCPNCGFDPEREPQPLLALPLGTVLNGRYLTGKVLGMGGFGVTYLGFDLVLEIKVAIKEYLPAGIAARNTDRYTMTVVSQKEAANYRAGAERFLDEARLLAKLKNVPNIVGVQDYFEENNTAYFVMDFVDGESLKHLMEERNGKLLYEEAKTILLPIMEALSQVHAQNLLHRDVSPDNIFLAKDGSPRLLDFGAARFTAGNEKSLSVILKHGFAPMEQYSSRGNQGPWTDIYAMAATFYYCITGVLPMDSMDRLYEDTMQPPIALCPSMPPSASAALMMALSVRPEERFQSMRAFINALSATQADSVPAEKAAAPKQSAKQPIMQNAAQTAAKPPVKPAAVPSPKPDFFERLKTDKKLLAAVCGGGVLLVALAVVLPLTLGGKKPNPEPDKPVIADYTPVPEATDAPVQTPPQQPLPDGASIHEDTVLNCSIMVPEGYTLREYDNGGGSVEKPGEIQVLYQHVVDAYQTVVYDAADMGRCIEDVGADYIMNLLSGCTNIELRDMQKDAQVGGRDAYIYTLTGHDTELDCDCSMVLAAVDSDAPLGCYLIIVSVARTQDADAHKALLSEGLDILGSFNVTGAPQPDEYAGALEVYSDAATGMRFAYDPSVIAGSIEVTGDSSFAIYPVGGNREDAGILLMRSSMSSQDASLLDALHALESAVEETLADSGFTLSYNGDPYNTYNGRYDHLFQYGSGSNNRVFNLIVLQAGDDYWFIMANFTNDFVDRCDSALSQLLWSLNINY